jgi:hypothetical protein
MDYHVRPESGYCPPHGYRICDVAIGTIEMQQVMAGRPGVADQGLP